MSLSSGLEHEIEVRSDLESVYGQYLDDDDGDSYAYLGVDDDLGQLVVEDAEIVDFNFVKVEFSQMVDEDSALVEDNYRLTDQSSNLVKKSNRIYYYQDEDGVYNDTVMVRFSSIKKNNDYDFEVTDVLIYIRGICVGDLKMNLMKSILIMTTLRLRIWLFVIEARSS